MECDYIEFIKNRYTCRNFIDSDVSEKDLKKILDCARFAPSGLNNQPWRFVINRDPHTRKRLEELTTSGNVIKQTPVQIIVLLDKLASYHHEKDIQAIGACIENILLAASALGYGTCWIGEILKNADEVLKVIGADPERYDLMAVIALGVPVDPKAPPISERERKELDELILKEIK